MKRLTFLAVIVALFSFSAAKAQVRVHVGLNFGAPYYPRPHRVVVVQPQPVYYNEPAPVYYNEPAPVYYPAAYHRRVVVVNRGYYGPRRVVYVDRFHGRGHAWGHRRY